MTKMKMYNKMFNNNFSQEDLPHRDGYTWYALRYPIDYFKKFNRPDPQKDIISLMLKAMKKIGKDMYHFTNCGLEHVIEDSPRQLEYLGWCVEVKA